MQIQTEEKDKFEAITRELLNNNFTLLKELGKGGYARVYLIRHNQTGKELVMKALLGSRLNKEDCKQSDLSKFREEALISAKLKGVHLVQSHFALKFNGLGYGIIMEKARHINLNVFIQAYHSTLFQGSYLYSINKTWFFRHNNTLLKYFVQQIIEGLQCMHRYSLVHMDVKPDNILLTDGFTVKLCDYGQTMKFSPNNAFVQPLTVGTPYYMSPEYFKGEGIRSKDLVKVDSYALGVSIYKMLYNSFFINKDERISLGKRQQLIRNAQKKIEEDPFINKDLKDLTKGLLEFNTNSRVSIEEASRHKWLKDSESDRTIERVVEVNGNEQLKLLTQMHVMDGLMHRKRKRNTYFRPDIIQG